MNLTIWMIGIDTVGLLKKPNKSRHELIYEN